MKFLIADDDPVSRLALSHLVAELPDAELIQADDGDAAWLALEAADEPIISLLDNRMPGLSGIDVLKKMRQSLRYLGWPVLLVTGTADRSLVSEAVQFGVSGFVLKPVAEDALLRISDLATQFEHSILEPLSETAIRLDTSPGMVNAYMHSLIKQLDVLIDALANITEENFPLVKKRADTSRSAALMLGSHHLEMLLEKLIASLDGDVRGDLSACAEAIVMTRNRIGRVSNL